MLFPKKVKFRKWQTQRTNLKKVTAETRGTRVVFGSFGLKSDSYARVKSNQIEAARKAMVRTITKIGKFWIRIYKSS